jgi:hypothetical protein
MQQEKNLEALAEYFTGPAVVFNSVGLQMGGDRRVGGDAFFTARNALGVTGYMNKDEAKRAIAVALGIGTP